MIELQMSRPLLVRFLLASVVAPLFLGGASAARAGWHQWTRTGVSGSRHPAEATQSLRVPHDMHDGGRVCAEYTNDDEPRKGKVELVVDVVRDAGTRGSTQVERIDFGSRNLKRQPRAGHVRFHCRSTQALRAGDTLFFRFNFEKIATRKEYHRIDTQLEPPLSKRSWIKLRDLEPGFGTSLPIPSTAELRLRYACREAAGCLVTATFTGETVREGNRHPFPVHPPELSVQVGRSRGTLSLPINVCNASARRSDGLLLRIERLSRELLNEQWHRGTYDCQ